MAKSPKTPEGAGIPSTPGVEEVNVEYQAPASDRWAVARERLAEYRRTGESISVDDLMEELDRAIAERRAAKG